MKTFRIFLAAAFSSFAAFCLSFSPAHGQATATAPATASTVDFMRDVKPLLEGACVQCHGPNEKELEADYRIDSKEDAFRGGSSYRDEVIFPGEANKSPVYWMTNLHEDEPDSDECMPPQKPLNKAQQQVLFDWIQGGAEWPDDVFLEDKPRVNFENVRQILINSGEFEATEQVALLKEIDARLALHDGPFSISDKEALELWIEQGRDWPEGASLGTDGPADNFELVEKIRAVIIEGSPETAESEMADYGNAIPDSDASYQMVAVKGGEFTMGSPDSEAGRFDDEGPQHPVVLEPFWMGKFEVTWEMYDEWAKPKIPRYKDGSAVSMPADATLADIVSGPTEAFMPMDFGMGIKGYPAVCMTQHAAMKFCQWLSAKTGHYYRLPTEAEWEYACRAGTTTAFSHGDDEAKLEEYAVYDPTQVRVGYEKIGTKKPNPWGLHDMHGNVLEWCLDQYITDAFEKRNAGAPTLMPFEKPTQLYPRATRGGSWYDPAEEVRSARRISSHENWKMTDPQLPKSIWYHTDAPWLGFRIVRPLKTPSAEEMHEIWNIGIATGP